MNLNLVFNIMRSLIHQMYWMLILGETDEVTGSDMEMSEIAGIEMNRLKEELAYLF